MSRQLHRIIASFCVGVLVLAGVTARAARIDELREDIAAKNTEIAQIEKEIAEYERQLAETGKQRASLENTIKTLDLARQKLLTDIKLTEQKIQGTTFSIEKLSLEIDDKETTIAKENAGLAAAIRSLNEADQASFIEILLATDTLSDFWNSVDSTERFQESVRADVVELKELRADLLIQQGELKQEETTLKGFRTDLSNQKKVVEANKREKNTLLTATKNQETQYQSLLEEKRAKEATLEQEIIDIENQIRITIDPSALPQTGSGVLRWPLDAIRITQYFGNTPFASKNPQVYNGGGHNGIDLGAPPGTRVKAALSGVVEGIGDTDTVCRYASYGKWVLIRHHNGLSTLYAHLSVISVSTGANVSTGDIIGYSGNTGYSTGPHLHFTVYATQGVQIKSFPSKACVGAIFTIPVADRRAYLNPLSYL